MTTLSVFREEISQILCPLLELLPQTKPRLSVFSSRIYSVMSRLESGKFNLAVLGQFKRGKSTLLNALLGNNVLPSDVVPVTVFACLYHFWERK